MKIATNAYKNIIKYGGFIVLGADDIDFNIYHEFNIPHIIPGSFNPLHNGHKAIYDTVINKYGENNTYYEISINRFEKPPYSFDELNQILSQFEYEKLIISSSALFKDKIELYGRSYFHIGYDVFPKINDIESLNAVFKVYPRCDKFLDHYGKNYYPANLITNKYLDLSSTNLRNPNERPTPRN